MPYQPHCSAAILTYNQYLYIRHNNLYLLALTKRNTNAAEILLFLHKIVEVFTEYFKELEEESIRDNFVVIYELLDEMMDFGYPQTTESKILQEYITQESHKLEVQARPPIAVTNAVSWRSEGIRYRKNEVFLDVVESLNLLVSSNGNVLRSEILGAIKMKCYLSGMPELRLGLNDKVMFETTGRATRGKAIEMEDVRFHQCVRLARFENDRTISFIPPDGEFELMSYRLNTAVKPLIWVECIVESHSGSRIEYMLKAKAQFKRRSTANNVEITVPVPEDADSPRFRTNIGSVHYAPEKSAIVWKIKQFGGNKEFLMRAELGLPSVKGDDELGGGMTGGFGGSMGGVGGKGAKRPISVKFEIPYFTTSGIQVRYLKIIEPKVLTHPLLNCGTSHMVTSPIGPLSMALDSNTDTSHSFNTRHSHGSATSHNQATSPSDYQTLALQPEQDRDEHFLAEPFRRSKRSEYSPLGMAGRNEEMHFRRQVMESQTD
jgi:AP-1 complex subunit mu